VVRTALAGIGAYLPERIVSNAELSERVETSDAWIQERTGIKQRHLAGPLETCAYMGTEAARRALADAGAGPGDVDAIILATSTPDQAFPATALRVQAARHPAGIRLRPVRRLQRFRLCALGRGRHD
jgi:3-oxoacyl-[acyl-carrier-protein] synthase-3